MMTEFGFHGIAVLSFLTCIFIFQGITMENTNKIRMDVEAIREAAYPGGN